MPPDNVSANLTPNPDGRGRRRSRAEEQRTLDAIKSIVISLARESGIEASGDTGCIDPAAKINEERAQAIKNDTQPKLAEFTRKAASSIEVDRIASTSEGFVISGLKMRKGAETKLGLNLKELADLARQALNMFEAASQSVIAIAVRVISAAALAFAKDVPAEHNSDSVDNPVSEVWDDDDFDDPYPPTKEDRDP